MALRDAPAILFAVGLAVGCAAGGDGGATGGDDAHVETSFDAPATESSADTAPSDGLIFEVEPPDDASCPGTMCTGRCSEEQDDPLNCGACGVECTSDQFCSVAIGGPPCKCRKPMVACSGACTDRDTDPSSCGECGVTCPTACSRGACVGACPADRTGCPAAGGKTSCVDTATDARNCGACGVRCDTSKLCVAGKCVDYRPAVGCAACPCAICSALVGAPASCCAPLLGHVTATCVAASSCP